MAIPKEGWLTDFWAGIVVASMAHELGVVGLYAGDDRKTWFASAETVSPTRLALNVGCGPGKAPQAVFFCWAIIRRAVAAFVRTNV